MKKRVLSLALALCLLSAFVPVVIQASPSQKTDFINRINAGFHAIVTGDYDNACDIFGFSGKLSKASFNFGMDIVNNSSLTLLYATVDEASVNEKAGIMTATVTLYVQQDATERTFGNIQEYPIGIYSMDFIVEMKNGAISIPKHIWPDGALASGLAAIYLPGQTENSLKVLDAPADFLLPFIYASPAGFMSELWKILQSYDLESETAIFWGYGVKPSGEQTPVPPTVDSLDIVWKTTTIAADSNHSLAIKDEGSLWAWGENYSGEIGDGTVTTCNDSGHVIEDIIEDNNKRIPTIIMDSVMSVSAGREHNMVIKSDGSLWAWGSNYYGSLGNGMATRRDPHGNILVDNNRLLPVKIMDSVAMVSAGAYYNMAIRTDGSLWAWGYNCRGQLGNGTQTDWYTPIKIMDSVASISAGGDHSMAIKTDGSLWVWGSNQSGQIGDGTQTDRYSPVKIMDSVVSISAGSGHSMAIKTDGSLWVWGDNWQGQLGDGTTETRVIPVKILDSVVSVSAGSIYSMAIKSDGSLWAWGDNLNNTLGDGTTERRLSPIKIMDSMVSVSVGSNHAIALKSDGSLWTWGRNFDGQLGDGTTERKFSPVKIMDSVKLPGAKSPPPNSRTSTGTSAWAVEQVNAAIAAGLVPYSLQSLHTQATTRAEFTALAVVVYERAKGAITGRAAFTDTSDVNVQKMAYIGVVSGVGNNRFDPDAQLTREQAAVMLSRLSDAIGQPFPTQASTFTDITSSSSWTLESIGRVEAAGLMSGTGNNNFSPRLPYTREQSIVTFLRLFSNVG